LAWSNGARRWPDEGVRLAAAEGRIMSGSVLFDAPGPRARRRIQIGSAVAVLVMTALVALAVKRLADRGQLDARRWAFVTDPAVLRFLCYGLLNTLKVAAVAGVLSLVIGAALAIGKLAPAKPARAVATGYVQFWRAIPLLLLIYFVNLSFPTMGLKFPAFWFLVIGLTLYNSAIFAEIFRAGVLSLPRGQREAANALGLTFGQSMRLILLPQAIRRMVPTLVGQYVVLLKDSSLGFVLPYPELLRRGQLVATQYSQSVLQSYIVVAVVFVAVNASLSYLARWLERRQRRGRRSGAATEAGPGATVGSGAAVGLSGVGTPAGTSGATGR
jgi:glutamate transport system permease protein